MLEHNDQLCTPSFYILLCKNTLLFTEAVRQEMIKRQGGWDQEMARAELKLG